MARVLINHDSLRKLRKKAFVTTDRELAHLLGVSKSTVCRVMSGELLPSNQFIGSALQLFNVKYEHLFCTVPDEGDRK